MTNICNRAILVHANAINNQQRLEAVQFLERLGQRIKGPPFAGRRMASWIPACAGMIFFLTVSPSCYPCFRRDNRKGYLTAIWCITRYCY